MCWQNDHVNRSLTIMWSDADMIKYLSRMPLMLGSLLAIAACSSGGGGSEDELGSGGGSGITDPSELPISGSARYNGFLTLSLPTSSGRSPYIGTLGLDVDFDAADVQVTGQVTDFSTDNDDNVAGRLVITDGVIDRGSDVVEDYTFDAGISGTLSGEDFRNMVITGTMLGDFNGQNAETLSGRVFGDVIGPTGEDIYNGTFSGTSE